MKCLGAGECRQLEDVHRPHAGSRHDRDAVPRSLDKLSHSLFSQFNIWMQATGQDSSASQIDDLLQRLHRILHPVECPVKGDLHGAGPVNQLRASLGVDGAVFCEHADYHAVAAQV